MTDDDTPRIRSAGADLVIPVAGFAYSIYYVYSVWDFPLQAQISGMMLAGLLMLLSLIFFIRTAFMLAAGRARMSFTALLGPREGRGGRIIFVLLTLAYLLVGDDEADAVLARAALGGWLFFIVILGTRFPPGPFERLVQPLLTAIGL